MILKVEYDPKQCAHILLKKGQNHSHNHMGQNNILKTRTPYLKGPEERCGEQAKA